MSLLTVSCSCGRKNTIQLQPLSDKADKEPCPGTTPQDCGGMQEPIPTPEPNWREAFNRCDVERCRLEADLDLANKDAIAKGRFMANRFREAEELYTMRLAGISTATTQNTRTTIKDRITRESPYWTQAYADVCIAIDREMNWREKYDELTARLEELRGRTEQAERRNEILSDQNNKLRESMDPSVTATQVHLLQTKLMDAQMALTEERAKVENLANTINRLREKLRKVKSTVAGE